MFRPLFTATLLGILPMASLADGDFGTREEARQLADLMMSIVDRDGIEAAVTAMHEPDLPFVTARMGINLISGSTVIADNR